MQQTIIEEAILAHRQFGRESRVRRTLFGGQMQQNPGEDGTLATAQDIGDASDVGPGIDELHRSVPHSIDKEVGHVVPVVLDVRFNCRAASGVRVLFQSVGVVGPL